MDERAEELETFRRAFRKAFEVDDPLPAFPFGDSPHMADELARLVVDGPKRATVALMAEIEHDNEPIPLEGEHWIVADGRGSPVCAVRTVEVEIKPLRDVDPSFAWDEGEGDRTLEWWLEAHRRYFGRRCTQLSIPFTDDMPALFERFSVVWPRPDDRAGPVLDDGTVTVRALRHHEGTWARDLLVGSRGSTRVAGRGVLHQADRLPGLVAERDGERSGLLTFRPGHGEAEIITVDAASHGPDVIEALLEAMAVVARRQGWRWLCLVARDEDREVLRLGRQHGWQPIKVEKDAVEPRRLLARDLAAPAGSAFDQPAGIRDPCRR